MIVTCSEMKELEARTFAEGVSAEALMEEAGAQIAAAVRQFFPTPATCLAFIGKGHNGGDALVAARHLAATGWRVRAQAAFAKRDWSPLTRKKFSQFEKHHSKEPLTHPVVVLDGLLGIGAGGVLRDPIATAAREINRLRHERAARVFAIDVPTGLNADSGETQNDAVIADFTLTIGFPKPGLLADSAARCVGRLAILPLQPLTQRARSQTATGQVITPEAVAKLLPLREFDVHKGNFGRVGIVAGSRGLTGAAVMCADACVRAGAGLVTLYVTEDIHPIVAAAAAPEVMVRPVGSYLELLDTDRDVLALGPGLGQDRRDQVLELVAAATQPAILDADALNIVATQPEVLERCAGPRLLTPHPGEMKRLDPAAASLSRQQVVEAFIARFTHTLLLKGARTLVGQRGRALCFNTTGSPGMATGGMGDILTGVCAALAGHGLSLYDTARTAAWLCGRAAELAVYEGSDSEESLSATRILDWIGIAFKRLRRPGY